MKTEYVDFLCSEYEQADLKPESVVIGNSKYIVPYIYIKTNNEPLKLFLTDFFDVMRKDYILYLRNKEPVRYINWYDGNKNRHLIVPYTIRYNMCSDEEIVNRIIEKARKKYKKAIMTAYELKKTYPNMVFERMISSKAFKEMLKAHKKCLSKQKRNMAVYITERVGRFMSQNPEKITNNMDGVLLYVLRQKAKKWALKVVLCAAVETSVFEAINISSDN